MAEAALIAAVAAGVLLPKALPVLAVSGQIVKRFQGFLDVLPCATLAALAGVLALGPHAHQLDVASVGGVAIGVTAVLAWRGLRHVIRAQRCHASSNSSRHV